MVKNKTKKITKTSRKQTSSRGAVNARTATIAQDNDSNYFLKLVLYLILGTLWLRITSGGITFPAPVGLIIGLLFARTEKFSIDRKIEYAVLLLAAFIAFWLPIGFEFVF